MAAVSLHARCEATACRTHQCANKQHPQRFLVRQRQRLSLVTPYAMPESSTMWVTTLQALGLVFGTMAVTVVGTLATARQLYEDDEEFDQSGQFNVATDHTPSQTELKRRVLRLEDVENNGVPSTLAERGSK